MVYHSTQMEVGAYLFPRNSRTDVDFVVISGDQGCAMNCCCIRSQGVLLVGNTSGVHVMNTNGITHTYPFWGKKKYVMMKKDSALIGSFDDNGQQVVSIYDLKNQFIEYNGTLFRSGKAEYIAFILNIWNSILIITRSHSVFHLQEKDLQTKLESLFSKNKFDIALSIAQAQKMDLNGLLDIHRR